MTLILGWKINNTVYISGDSAITSSIKSKSTADLKTSFTESIIDEDKLVIDTSLKIDMLHNKVVIASAGNVFKCRNIIKDINYRITVLELDVYEIIEKTLSDYNNPSDCAFIISFIQNKETKLFSYNDNELKKNELREYSDFIYAGSIKESLLDGIRKISLSIVNSNLNPSRTLLTLNAILQSVLLRNPQMEQGIGGFCSGVYINFQGIKTLEDITYLIYNKGFPISDSGINISIAMRENGVFIYTPQKNVSNKIFLNTYTDNPSKEIENWYKKYYNNTDKKINSSDSKYIVFLHSTLPIISLLATNNKKYIKTKSVETLKREISLTGSWLNKLFTYIKPTKENYSEENPLVIHFGWD